MSPGELPVQELTDALTQGRVEAWYQPIVELQAGRVRAVEALARLRRRDGSVRFPDAFLPAAEASGLIMELDRAVLAQALADLDRLGRTGHSWFLHVNISSLHLEDDERADALLQLIADAAVDPRSVRLELTEERRPSDPGAARLIMDRVRSAGPEIWLDDFGSGLSGPADLHEFDIDGIKIDKSLAAALVDHRPDDHRPDDHRPDDHGAARVRDVVGLAASYGLPVIIEGVETVEQERAAIALGCRYGQGHHWSPALPIEELQRWVNRRRIG